MYLNFGAFIWVLAPSPRNLFRSARTNSGSIAMGIGGSRQPKAGGVVYVDELSKYLDHRLERKYQRGMCFVCQIAFLVKSVISRISRRDIHICRDARRAQLTHVFVGHFCRPSGVCLCVCQIEGFADWAHSHTTEHVHTHSHVLCTSGMCLCVCQIEGFADWARTLTHEQAS